MYSVVSSNPAKGTANLLDTRTGKAIAGVKFVGIAGTENDAYAVYAGKPAVNTVRTFSPGRVIVEKVMMSRMYVVRAHIQPGGKPMDNRKVVPFNPAMRKAA